MVELSSYEALVLALGSLFFGLFLLVRAGGWVIDSAVHIALHRGVSPMVVGFTIVGFGTSFPELVVSVLANIQGAPGIALGNVIGSNIANILLILGFVALFTTLRVPRTPVLFFDLGFMVLCSLWLAVMLSGDYLGRFSAFLMLMALLGIVFLQFKRSQRSAEKDHGLEASKYQNDFSAFFFLILGLLSIAAGAEFLVKGAQLSASMAGVPDSVIALSIVALGTSLPELSTSIIAARRGQDAILIGNIIGSNVFNILMILGFSALIKPITAGSFSPELANFDVWLALAVAIVFSGIMMIFGKINRLTGFLFCIAYFAYNVYIYAASLA
ncbi:MAG: calcium/sodium antiporter [Alphaproteobacteria bacterium]|nr:calcium/sodium antiporter [Alphaproteobacteria bacterium]